VITIALDEVLGDGPDRGVAFLTVTYTEVPEKMRDLVGEDDPPDPAGAGGA